METIARPTGTKNESGIILIIEDSQEDYEAIAWSLEKAKVTNPLNHCRDGEEALNFLFASSPRLDSGESRLAFILLDLNMPGTDGFATIQTIKQDPTLKKVPLIVFSSSKDPRDIDISYNLGANGFVQKPIDLEGLRETIATLSHYWLNLSVLP